MEGLLKGSTKRVPFNHGIEKENIWVMGSAKDAICVGHFVKGPANGDEVGKDLV